MKRIFFVIMILLGFNIFSEENENLDINANKTEEVIVEENNNEDEKSKVIVTDTSEISSETEEKNKMFRLKLVGGINGEIRDNVNKEHISEAGVTYEGLLESVYRISDTYEVAMGTGVQKLGIMKFKEIGASKDYENVYAIPLYIAVKRNFFKGPVYFKTNVGMSFNIPTDDVKEILAGAQIKSGFYYGAGLGLDIGNIEVEAMYAVNELGFLLDKTVVGTTTTYTYSELTTNRISLGVSIAF